MKVVGVTGFRGLWPFNVGTTDLGGLWAGVTGFRGLWALKSTGFRGLWAFKSVANFFLGQSIVANFFFGSIDRF